MSNGENLGLHTAELDFPVTAKGSSMARGNRVMVGASVPGTLSTDIAAGVVPGSTSHW